MALLYATYQRLARWRRQCNHATSSMHDYSNFATFRTITVPQHGFTQHPPSQLLTELGELTKTTRLRSNYDPHNERTPLSHPLSPHHEVVAAALITDDFSPGLKAAAAAAARPQSQDFPTAAHWPITSQNSVIQQQRAPAASCSFGLLNWLNFVESRLKTHIYFSDILAFFTFNPNAHWIEK